MDKWELSENLGSLACLRLTGLSSVSSGYGRKVYVEPETEGAVIYQGLTQASGGGSVKSAERKQHGVRENEGNLGTHVGTQT